jgi:hypothetical protein
MCSPRSCEASPKRGQSGEVIGRALGVAPSVSEPARTVRLYGATLPCEVRDSGACNSRARETEFRCERVHHFHLFRCQPDFDFQAPQLHHASGAGQFLLPHFAHLYGSDRIDVVFNVFGIAVPCNLPPDATPSAFRASFFRRVGSRPGGMPFSDPGANGAISSRVGGPARRARAGITLNC